MNAIRDFGSVVEIRPVGRGEYDALAEAIVSVSTDQSRHCLHSWAGDAPSEIRDQLLSYLDDGELLYLAAYDDGSMIGAVGAEFDTELGRAWLHGPHVFGVDDRKTPAFESIAGALFDAIIASLPSTINQWDAYPNVLNESLASFYRARGFGDTLGISYEFGINREERPKAGASPCPLLAPSREADFALLFDELFPKTYYSAERILEMRGERFSIFESADESVLLGFAVASVDPAGAKGEIEFLGVRASARRRGLGRRLLGTAVDWLLSAPTVHEVVLNVSDVNADARRLYETAGFRLRYAGQPLRKRIGH